MHDMPPVFTQLDISATSIAPTHQAHSDGGEAADIRQLLAEMVALQQRTCGLLGEMLAQVSLQQRQRAGVEQQLPRPARRLPRKRGRWRLPLQHKQPLAPQRIVQPDAWGGGQGLKHHPGQPRAAAAAAAATAGGKGAREARVYASGIGAQGSCQGREVA
jgi:hypothetical protein